MLHLPVVAVPFALCAAVAAQTVHTVGPGGFAQVQAAITAAANGDVILVQPGTYGPFTLDKDLTITTPPGTFATILPTPFGGVQTVVQPPGEARIRGLQFRSLGPSLSATATRVLAGSVHFADCAFESSSQQFAPALLVQNCNVVMQRCVAIGNDVSHIGPIAGGAGADGVQVVHANFAAVDCLFFGGSLGFDFSGHGGRAVVVDDARVQLTNCIAIGGSNNSWATAYTGGGGVLVASTSDVWIADCHAEGGDGHGNHGGDGLANLGTTPMQVARSTFVGGPGAPPGAAIVGPSVTAPLLGLRYQTPAIQLGSSWPVGFVDQPGTAVLVVWSDQLFVTAAGPLLAEPAWLPATFAVAAVGVTDATGHFDVALPMPSSPALLFQPFYLQGVAGVAFPLQVSPPVGGIAQ